MNMTDAEVMRELQSLSGLPLEDDSQDRETVEDEFPGIARAVYDPYQE